MSTSQIQAVVSDSQALRDALQQAGELSPDGSYGVAQSLAGQSQGVDEKTACARFTIVTNETQNRNGNGHLLLKNQYGKGLLTAAHKANPVVLFDHGFARSLPIALASSPTQSQLRAMAKSRQQVEDLITQGAKEDTINAVVTHLETQLSATYSAAGDLGAYSVQVAETQATSAAWFNQSDEFAMQIFGLVAQGYVRMASIGFRARKAVRMQEPDPQRRDDPTIDFDRYHQGLQFTETELTEWSVVTIGADRGSFRQCLDSGRCGQETLSSTMRTYLQRIVSAEPQTRVTVPGSDVPKPIKPRYSAITLQHLVRAEVEKSVKRSLASK